MSSKESRYAQYPSFDEVRSSRFRGEVSEGRCWQTPLARLRLGDIHVEPANPEHALFSDLVVNVWGGKYPPVVVASSYDSDLPSRNMNELLRNKEYIARAVGGVLAEYDVPEPYYD